MCSCVHADEKGRRKEGGGTVEQAGWGGGGGHRVGVLVEV
jgi:hypothetical protein